MSHIETFFERQTLGKLLLIHGLIFVLRAIYLVGGPFDLFSEEAQYWVWSKELALSYYSKPPLIAYLNFLSTHLFGTTVFAVKFNALSFGLASSILAYMLSKEIFEDRRQAVVASFLVYAFPFNHTVFNLFLTDTPLCFFWALSLFFFWRALNTDTLKYWVYLGLSCGLGLLSKYTMVFFAPFALALILYENRKLLRKPGPYVSLLIAAIFASPILIWSVQNDFISFRHVSSIGASSLTFGKRMAFAGEYLGGQIGFMSPFLLPFIILSVRKFSQHRQVLFLLTGPVLVFAFFLCYSLTKRVEVNWTVFAYFPLPVLLANWLSQSPDKKMFSWMVGLSTGLSILFFYFTPLLYAVGLGSVFPPKNDPAARLMGWKEMGQTIEEHVSELNGEDYFLFSESYHTASEAAFFSDYPATPVVLNLGRRKNQFDLWPGIEKYEDSKAVGIYVTRLPEIPKEVVAGFGRQIKTDTIPVVLGGVVVKQSIVASFRELKHIDQKISKSY